jgi:fructuronate reductase
MRLSAETAPLLPPEVSRIVRRRAHGSRRIVHFGVGSFFKAHQAVYTDEAVEAGGDDWRVTGVSLRSPDVRDALAPQDWWYTVTERANGTGRVRAVSTLDRVIVAPENPRAVIDALASSDTHLVTITVTEKGYHRVPATGRLDKAAPEIRAELAGDGPRTIFGYLTAALAERRANGAGGLTILSCDNLSGNGKLLFALLCEFVQAVHADLVDWIRTTVACPDTMVDRIVPAPTTEHRTTVAAALGMTDEGAVVTEPFRQWVIEDRFVGPRPIWEAVGAQIVADVRPFELAKLRLLNAAHSTLAYAGLALGHAYVHQAIADPALGAFVMDQLAEAVPTLPAVEGLAPEAYVEAIIARFANADLRHELRQIASDGSQKLPQRWFATVAERAEQGRASPFHLTAIAIWIDHTGGPAAAPDPLNEHYAAIWRDAGRDPARLVGRYLDELGLFPPGIAANGSLRNSLADALDQWRGAEPRAMSVVRVAER